MPQHQPHRTGHAEPSRLPPIPRGGETYEASDTALAKVAGNFVRARGGSVEKAISEGVSVCLCCMDERVAPERNLMGHTSDMVALRDPGAGLLRVATGQVRYEDFLRQLKEQHVTFVCSHNRCGASEVVTSLLEKRDPDVERRLSPILGAVGIGQIHSKGRIEPDLAGELFARRTSELLGASYWNLFVNSQEHYSHNVYVDLAGKTAGRFKDNKAGAARNGFVVSHPRFYGIRGDAALEILASEVLIASRIIMSQASDRSKGAVQAGILYDAATEVDAQRLEQRISSSPGSESLRVELIQF